MSNKENILQLLDAYDKAVDDSTEPTAGLTADQDTPGHPLFGTDWPEDPDSKTYGGLRSWQVQQAADEKVDAARQAIIIESSRPYGTEQECRTAIAEYNGRVLDYALRGAPLPENYATEMMRLMGHGPQGNNHEQ